jgi:hypothetical protein
MTQMPTNADDLVTQVETAKGVIVAQSTLHIYRLLTVIELSTDLPMFLETDIKGRVDLSSNWHMGGCTQNFDVRSFFLREVKAKVWFADN